MLVLLAVTIPLTVGPCRLESAVVTHVPPDAAHVITVSECGGVERCWERWVETDGKRLGYSRVCAGYDSKFQTAPLP